MKRTLFIYGSLADQAVQRKRGSSQDTDVLEIETMLPASQRIPAASWTNAMDLLTEEDAFRIDAEANSLLDFYLQESDADADAGVPVHRAFRAACLGMACRKWMVPYLVNLELAKQIFARQTYQRIIVSPGAGISFRAWTQIAAYHRIPVEFLPKEPSPWSFARKWQRLLNRWKMRSPAVQANADQTSKKGPARVLCASARLSRLLHSQPESQSLNWHVLSDALLGQPDAQEAAAFKSAYRAWWQKKELELLAHLDASTPDSKSILADLGRQQSDDLYPRFAWKYLQAKKHLASVRPDLLLCDTQEGSDERAWSLAAMEMGIPTAAYTYDHIPQPRFSFRPTHLLCDSGRNAYIATHRGHQRDRIVDVASHRRPQPVAERPPVKETIILYADSYYSGTTATVEPQRSYCHYQLILETARKLPGMKFHLKFHPLRDRKKKDQCFIGMDEDELHVRTRFIQSLNPPSNVQIIPPEENMLQHLQKASVLLNSNSTAGLEGFVLGVPVVFLYAPNTELGFPLIFEHDACLVADNPEALVRELTRLTNDPDHAAKQVQNQRRYVNDFYWSSGRQSLVQGIQSILTAQAASQTAAAGTSEGGPKA